MTREIERTGNQTKKKKEKLRKKLLWRIKEIDVGLIYTCVSCEKRRERKRERKESDGNAGRFLDRN